MPGTYPGGKLERIFSAFWEELGIIQEDWGMIMGIIDGLNG